MFFLILTSIELTFGGIYYILYNIIINTLNQMSSIFGGLGSSNPSNYGLVIILEIIILILISGLLSFSGTYLGTYLKKVYSE
ncbi:hypothetical protein BGI41_03250 [Methanobrevibacter sp. 87.7]|uniref:hypothetical protein n=1 Tax=Methanobrevibacter sp. 87.7 TaxID=387957 RepID=UPI000B507757|nr:hypothetical protein [Methanobrevibacter sp. 87.7]OWT33273.1 hypothetical protein BGI41_03250 [Methanobrevibacter sp. 87.7]